MLLLLCVLAAGEPGLAPVAVASEPTIDGHLDDQAWEQAPVLRDSLVQQRPDCGNPMTEPMETRVVYGPRGLCFGFRLFDSSPHGITVAASPRDTDIATDWVGIMLDTFDDDSNCYVFFLSVAGTQYDMRLTEAAGYDLSWDAVWESGVHLDSLGWTAEVLIPWSSLRYAAAGDQTWGVNLKRTMSRTNESGYLYRVGDDGSIRVEDFGSMTLSGVPLNLPRELTLYGAGRLRNLPEDDEIDPWSSLGADLKLGLSASTTLDLTLNPDFGQVEADPDEVNLSNWESFLSEKRPFFLEQSELFAMPFNMFYSRRIGSVASNGEVTPILGGARLTGDRSGIRYGLMSAVTGNVREEGALLEPAAAYTAFRIVRETSTLTSLGGSITSVDIPGQDSLNYDWQRVAALDGAIQLPASHALFGELAGSWSSGGPANENGAFQAYLSKISDRLDYSVGARYLQNEFDANMTGYTTETGTIEKWARCGFYLPMERGGLQNAWGNLYLSHDATPQGTVTWKAINPSMGINFRNRCHISGWTEISGAHTDRYEGPEGFEYEGDFQGGGSASSDSRKPVYVYAGACGGDFRNGSWECYDWYLAVKPTSNVRLELNLDWERTFRTLRWSWNREAAALRDTDWRSAQITMYWIAGSALSLRLNGQLSRFRSTWSEEGEMSSGDGWANMLLTWRFSPGSALYLLAGQQAAMPEPGEYTRPTTTLFAKISYLL